MLNIKSFYCENFPSDELGLEINPAASFAGLPAAIKGDIVYEYLGVFDSVVRERVFEKLASLMGLTYNEVYEMWLNNA
jgi:hypothetical protein